MPAVTGTLQYAGNVDRTLARFSNASDATMREVLLHELMEHGGDFQNSRFTADTHIIVTRKAASGRRTHVREIPVCAWPDCSDLVDADVYTGDFSGEEI